MMSILRSSTSIAAVRKEPIRERSAGSGVFARQAPLANWSKLSPGCTERSMPARSTPTVPCAGATEAEATGESASAVAQAASEMEASKARASDERVMSFHSISGENLNAGLARWSERDQSRSTEGFIFPTRRDEARRRKCNREPEPQPHDTRRDFGMVCDDQRDHRGDHACRRFRP